VGDESRTNSVRGDLAGRVFGPELVHRAIIAGRGPPVERVSLNGGGLMATLNARLREGTGKGLARKLRAAGEVPAVAYGHGMEGRSLVVNAHELEKLLQVINPNTIIELRVKGAKPAQALIREVQYHPSRRHILHVDFFQVRATEKVHVEVPVRLHGTPIGVREQGGVLQEVLRELTVECFPKDIPAAVDLDVENLGIGQSIHVSDIQLPNATILNDAELVICTVTAPTVAALPEEEAGEGAEPEVIRERRPAGEGEAE
jgi:large subunit ribosomal protein L25